MKRINTWTFIAALTISLGARSNQDDVPPDWLKDGTITVTLKDGRTYTYSTNTHKVVRRGTGSKTALKPHNEEKSPEPSPSTEQIPISQPVAVKSLKNRFRLLGGYGYDGSLKLLRDPDYAEITPQRGVLFGVGYDRLLSDKISAGAVVISNGSLLLGVGADFE